MPSWPSRLLSAGSSSPNSAPQVHIGPAAHEVPPRTPTRPLDFSNAPLHGVPVLESVPAASSAPNISPTRRPLRHGRSISHPFPAFFGSAKRNEKRVDPVTIEIDFDPEDDEFETGKERSHTYTQRGTAQSTNNKLVAGRCATCDSTVRWPHHLEVYRCTVCLMINDLKSARDPSTTGNSNTAKKTDLMPSMRIPRKVLPLSLERTRKLIAECLTSYLRDVLNSPEPGNGAVAGVRLNERNRSASAPSKHSNDEQWSEPNIEANAIFPDSPELLMNTNSSGQLLEYYIHEASTSPDPHTPVCLGVSDGTVGPAPSRAPPSPPLQDQGAPHLVQAANGANVNAAKFIFRPLETYLAACLVDCECLNASFSDSKTPHPVRAASEASLLTGKPRRTGIIKDSHPTLSGLDAKTILIGNIAENGMWWTGDRSRTQKKDANKFDHFKETRDRRTPRIDWASLDDWYDAIYSCGSSWKTQWTELDVESALKSKFLTHLKEQHIEEVLAQARLHVQRTFLKTIENLLRRPGRPLKSPDDSRFLFILLANPLLYPQHGSTRSRFPYDKVTQLSSDKQRNEETSMIRSSTHRMRSAKTDNGQRGSATGQHSGIIKRVLGLVAHLPNECHQVFISWFRRFPEAQFRELVELVGGFVSYRLNRQSSRVRNNSRDLIGGLVPSISGPGAGTSAYLHATLGPDGSSKTPEAKDKNVPYCEDWQIKAAAKVMSLLFSANNNGRSQGTTDHAKAASSSTVQETAIAARQRALRHAQILPTSVFYNTLLDYADLISDFESWESKRGKFSFCQYPMFLSIWAKIHIMEYDARRQMEAKARDAFFNSILSRKAISQHLVLKVRRDCLVDDSLRGVSEVVGTGQEEIKKGLRIEFIGEEGVDAGGLRKEWFLLLVREVFDPEHGLFVYDEDSQYCYFNPNSFENSDQFFLVGVVLGLAIYNSTILDVALPPFAFRKLLASAPVYTGPVTSSARPASGYSLEDLAEWRPSLARGLKHLLEHDGDVEGTFCRNFVADVDRYGQAVQVPLCTNGENRPITNNNRREFVDLYIHYLLDTAVVRQYEPFKRGFFTVCGGNALSLFRPEEIELLVRGSDEPLDVTSLQAVAVYEGWPLQSNGEQDQAVVWFWDAFAQADVKLQRKILGFITGSDRIPAMGATNLVIKVSCLGENYNRFPIARTCFNQIGLYRYRTKAEFEMKLWKAINESEGFGLK